MKKILRVTIDLGLAFLLIKLCTDKYSSYLIGLLTMLIWFTTDKLFKD